MSKNIVIALGNDHTAVALKNSIKIMLLEENYEVIDCGCDSTNPVDYPDYGHQVGETVAQNKADYGIVICGTGIGISIAANKIKGIRAALCYQPLTARLAREHNNANVLALGARITAEYSAKLIVLDFLRTPFDHGRHETRVNKIEKIG